uniref:Phosphoesterase n=1 Tax=uncultured bacterium psy1 TaxID=693111 RepID=D2SUE3_9BACT|nr:phosphoesterase [uncultured bacterium psy1]
MKEKRSMTRQSEWMVWLITCVLAWSLGAGAQVGWANENDEVRVTILHVNDLYQIASLRNGKLGGFARLTTLRKQLEKENPNTFVLFSGDLYEPSALGNAVVDGRPLLGRHAVGVLNEVGVDYMTFGDHEFNMSADQFYDRLGESRFRMLSSNLFEEDGQPFPGVVANGLLSALDEQGRDVTIGVLGVTKPFRTKIPMKYVDHYEAIAQQLAKLEKRADMIIALTHFPRKEDMAIAQRYPAINLILGADDHEHMKLEQEGMATVYKSDSNARSVYVLDLYINRQAKSWRIEDRLVALDESIEQDPTTLAKVEKWIEIGFRGFEAAGLEPRRVLGQTPVDLDGLESSIRNRPTRLTQLIGEGMLRAGQDAGAQVAYYPAGLVRLDDILPTDYVVREFDVMRTIPFEVDIATVTMAGEALLKVLESGHGKIGTGRYIIPQGAERDDQGRWTVQGQALDPSGTYKVVTLAGPTTANVVAKHGSMKDALRNELGRLLKKVAN